MKCAGCLASADCGSCVFCKDKKKFGGPGKKKKGCVTRKCVGVIESVRKGCKISCMHHMTACVIFFF